MTRFTLRRAALLAPSLALFVAATGAGAQTFGRNKVQYETFPWKILKSEHFDNYFYPSESLAVHDAARLAERWYIRQSELFRHAFFGKSLIFYADHPDFQQTNVIGESLEEGTGGVTESARTRVIMPFTGVYADNDHVIGHELVHVFQYNIAEGLPGGINRMGALPLWLVEGMAEYLTLGRDNALTAMWMRDAVMRDKFPTIKQITTDPNFFPYRYGQALWAYVGGRWGDRSVIDIYRTSLRLGWDLALIRTLQMNSDSLSKEWAAANKALYLPVVQSRTHPDSVGQPVIPLKKSGDQNLAPSASPDGKYLAFFSSRELFGIDLYLADAHTGKVIRKLAAPSSDPHFDALSFINSSGDWSADSKKFAFIVYADGNNEVAIVDVANSEVERRIKLPGIGAVTHVAWSPDGRTLAISGQAGGMTDLYLLDLNAGTLTQLTNDRYADLQPAWSPDGRSIAFVSDRGPDTDFQIMRFGDLNLSLLDLDSRQIRLLPRFARGKAINPQFSPDGRDIYFIANQDGIPDIYRLNLPSGGLFRITRVATGISGITEISPALTVSRGTGRMIFSIFKDQGQGLYALEASQAVGLPVETTPRAVAASLLPPPVIGQSQISAYLADPGTGLVDGSDFRIERYKPAFGLDQLGQPSLGVSTGGPFGTMLLGGIYGVFGDQLGDQQIFAAIQAQGTVKDIGGQFAYINLKKRWNWGAQAQHIPYLTGGVFVRDTLINTSQGAALGYNVYQVLQRVFVDGAAGFAQYPFSKTKRIELSGGITRLSVNNEAVRFTILGNTLVDQATEGFPSQPARTYINPAVALVGDNSLGAFTSPISGQRYRFEVQPTFGTFTMQSVTADWRRYQLVRPFTFAVRGFHFGRYGKDADSPQLWPLYLGDELYMRGYGYNSFTSDECVTGTQSTAGQTNTGCPVFDRLFGSRMMVASAEIRIPLFGVPEYGLINFPEFATHISPFFDAGISYTGTQSPSWRITRDAGRGSTTCQNTGSTSGNPAEVIVGCAERIPVFSAGLSARINVLGYMIFEAYVAHPFQRPKKDWVWGFQLAPGW